MFTSQRSKVSGYDVAFVEDVRYPAQATDVPLFTEYGKAVKEIRLVPDPGVTEPILFTILTEVELEHGVRTFRDSVVTPLLLVVCRSARKV